MQDWRLVRMNWKHDCIIRRLGTRRGGTARAGAGWRPLPLLPLVLFVLAVEWGDERPAGGEELSVAQVEQAGNDVLAGLEHATEFIKDAQWQDAVETVARLMENHGSALLPAPVSARAEALGHSKLATVSEHCQRELASWHHRAPAALAAYRQRVDDLAAQWLAAATRDRSEAQLQRIVDELLLSSSGDQALLLLGELALERGDYRGARFAWERISPQLRVPPAVARVLQCSPGCSWSMALRGRDLDALWPQITVALQQPIGSVNTLAYPDTDIALATVRARLVLASLLQGDDARAELEAELLTRLHPDDQGELAGRRGNLAQMAAGLVREAVAWPDPPGPRGWTTLGGCPQRNKVVPHSVDVACRGSWKTRLPRLEDQHDLLADGRVRVGERADGLLSYQLAVSDNVVFIQQPGVLRALRIDTGEPAWPMHAAGRSPDDETYGAIYQWQRAPLEVVPQLSSHAGVPRFGVTLHGGRLFARMGTAWTGGGELPVRDQQRSFLLGLDLRTQKLLFDPIYTTEAGWEFESAPLATEALLYVTHAPA